MRRIFTKRGNVWLWGGVGMVAGPWVLNTLRSVTGVGVNLPRIGGNGG